MAGETTVTPKRLKEIIAAEGKLKTFGALGDYRKTLKPEEVEAIEAYTQALPGAVKKEAPEEEPEEEEAGIPKRVKLNEMVDVYDEKRTRWYTAKWSLFEAGEDIEYSPISISVAGTYNIVGGIQGRRIIITSITLTVDGECFITLSSSYGNISGAMPFGAAGQPMGMAAGTGAYFIPLQEGAGFNITVSADVNVGGFVTYVRR